MNRFEFLGFMILSLLFRGPRQGGLVFGYVAGERDISCGVHSRFDMKAPPPKSAFGNMVDLDVKHAWKTFGGKTVEDVYQSFKEAAFPQVENFRWIAPE